MYKMPDYNIENPGELDDLLHYWIEVLGLNDWEIYVKFVDLDKCSDDCGCVFHGETTYLDIQKQATIIIMSWDSWEDYKKKTGGVPFGYDQEKTLVHELLHCAFCDIAVRNSDNNELDSKLHQILEMTARSLVRLKRMNP